MSSSQLLLAISNPPDMISNGIILKCYRRVSHKKSSSKSNRRFLNFKRYHSNIVIKLLKLELENEPAQNKKVSFYKYNTICLTNFLKTNLTEFAVVWVKKHKKAGFLSPISSKITLTKERERRKQRSEGKERRKREESNGRTLGFYNSYFGDGFWPKKKNGRTEKVHLAVKRFQKSGLMYIIVTWVKEICGYGTISRTALSDSPWEEPNKIWKTCVIYIYYLRYQQPCTGHLAESKAHLQTRLASRIVWRQSFSWYKTMRQLQAPMQSSVALDAHVIRYQPVKCNNSWSGH